MIIIEHVRKCFKLKGVVLCSMGQNSVCMLFCKCLNLYITSLARVFTSTCNVNNTIIIIMDFVVMMCMWMILYCVMVVMVMVMHPLLPQTTK